VSIKLKLIIPAILLLSGCAVSTTNTVATMPALKTGSIESTRTTEGLPTTVAVLPFANKTDSEFAYSVVRQTMFNHFSSKNYRMIHWQDVDRRLRLAGITTNEELMSRSRAELSQLLGVDGLIYGNITHYNKTLAAIYAQISVGVELNFVNSSDKVIWQVKDVRRSHAGGISTTPVGLILNALIAAKHVYGDLNLYRAADDLGRALAKDMPQPTVLNQKRSPSITNVAHSGVGQFLKYGDRLEIAMEGDAGLIAVASIEGIGLVILEEADAGQYVGELIIDKKYNVTDIVVTGRLQDEFGQTRSWISPYGLLNIDNIPPEKVTGLKVQSNNMSVTMDWDPSSDTNVAGYHIAVADSETGSPTSEAESDNSSYTVNSLNNFQEYYVSVRAMDKAGNISEAARVSVTAAPDARFADATAITDELPAVISGVYKLTIAGNPYILRNESRIATDGVLLIAPGVEIQVSPRAKLTVMGELHTFGSKESLVKVSAVGSQGFDEFLVLQSTFPVSLTGLLVTGAGIPIQINAGEPLISDSELENCKFNCLTISGSSRPAIRDTLISGAKASGVVISGQSQPTFTGMRFISNQPFHIQNSSTYHVDAKNNEWQPDASSITVLGDVSY